MNPRKRHRCTFGSGIKWTGGQLCIKLLHLERSDVRVYIHSCYVSSYVCQCAKLGAFSVNTCIYYLIRSYLPCCLFTTLCWCNYSALSVCVYVCCCFLHSVIIRSLSRSRPVLSYSHPHPPSHLIQNVFEFIFVFAYFSCIYIKYLNLLPSHCACNPLMQITRAWKWWKCI